jgi:hypothetical protein
MTGSSTLNMYRRFELWWFSNATWNVLRIKLRSITIGLLKGRPEYSSALGPERENDTVLKPSAVPVIRKDASAERVNTR